MLWKLLTGPSLGVFKVINWAKSKLLTGPRSFSHYKNRGFRRFFLLSYHCVCVCVFFVPNVLAIFQKRVPKNWVFFQFSVF